MAALSPADGHQLSIGIVASMTPNTGNMHTCTRLQAILQQAGYACQTVDSNSSNLLEVSL